MGFPGSFSTGIGAHTLLQGVMHHHAPDGVHRVGCSERQVSSGDVTLASLFVPFVKVDGATCDACCRLHVAAWMFTPGSVLICEACYQRFCRECADGNSV
jgi:hypothetical protein